MSETHDDTLHVETHIDVSSDDLSAIDLLADRLPLSRQKLKSALQNGCIWHQSDNGLRRIRRAKKLLKSGDRLHVYYDEKIQQNQTGAALLIADHGDYSIWNKPAGMYSQGSKWGDHNTLYRYAEKHLDPQRPAFIVHRLDRAANGLILLAHSKKAAAAFARLFETREITKQYRARVSGRVENSRLPLLIDDPIDGKEALTRILSVQHDADHNSTLLVSIETGRKHQIRRHLAALGHPILGDRLYGELHRHSGEMTGDMPDLNLQSYLLNFTCPLTNEVRHFTIDS